MIPSATRRAVCMGTLASSLARVPVPVPAALDVVAFPSKRRTLEKRAVLVAFRSSLQLRPVAARVAKRRDALLVGKPEPVLLSPGDSQCVHRLRSTDPLAPPDPVEPSQHRSGLGSSFLCSPWRSLISRIIDLSIHTNRPTQYSQQRTESDCAEFEIPTVDGRRSTTIQQRSYPRAQKSRLPTPIGARFCLARSRPGACHQDPLTFLGDRSRRIHMNRKLLDSYELISPAFLCVPQHPQQDHNEGADDIHDSQCLGLML